jgi:hypothetical protein
MKDSFSGPLIIVFQRTNMRRHCSGHILVPQVGSKPEYYMGEPGPRSGEGLKLHRRMYTYLPEHQSHHFSMKTGMFNRIANVKCLMSRVQTPYMVPQLAEYAVTYVQ